MENLQVLRVFVDSVRKARNCFVVESYSMKGGNDNRMRR